MTPRARAAGGHRAAGPIELLIRNLDECFEGPSWHGPSLLVSLRGIDPEQALWRPAPGRHCIWELALHAAYWKYIVRRRVGGGGARRGAFPRKGSNFPALPDRRDAAALAADLALLSGEHRQLREAVARFDPAALENRPGATGSTFRQHILGAAAHDVYHAGQIQLLKKLSRA